MTSPNRETEAQLAEDQAGLIVHTKVKASLRIRKEEIKKNSNPEVLVISSQEMAKKENISQEQKAKEESINREPKEREENTNQELKVKEENTNRELREKEENINRESKVKEENSSLGMAVIKEILNLPEKNAVI